MKWTTPLKQMTATLAGRPDSRSQSLRECGPHFDTLLTNLRAAGLDCNNMPQCLALTSTTHGEGVSTLASTLTVHLAQRLRKRILLIQTTKAAASPPWQTAPNSPAFTRVPSTVDRCGIYQLLAECSQLAQCLQHHDQPDISWLPSGHSDSPHQVLDPYQTTDLIHRLQREYPFIIVDLPPLADEGFAVSVAARLPSTLLVIEAERVASESIRNALDRLQHAGANVVGAIFNKHRLN